MWELALILVVALIVLGPRQLAEAARIIGRIYKELQRMAWDVRSSIDLDSITSPPPKVPHYEPLLPKSDIPAPSTPPPNVVTQAERSGPDFYAELLEQSREESEAEKPEKAETEEKQSPPTPSAETEKHTP
jgi:hypothetical protein